MKPQTAYKTVKLTPGQETPVDITGTSLYVDGADGPFAVSLDDGDFVRMDSGKFIEAPAGDYFRKVTFKSLVTSGGADVTVTYYAGTLRVGTRSPVVYTKPAPTYIVGYSANLATTVEYTIPNTNLRTGQPSADKQVRLQIMTTSGTAVLRVKVGGVVIGVCVTNGAMYPVETSDTVVIQAFGDTHTYHVAAFYALPA